MIVNRAMNSGGTGIILKSNKSQSTILTNDHVCRVVKKGGVVRSRSGDYQVESIVESETSDLCLISVLADLGVDTKISDKTPQLYDNLNVSGHPALMPNVVSSGHRSGRQIIQVMSGMRPCTEEEESGPLGLACLVFGGMPVVKSYESVLVTATIMPGSSGSGVYNSNGELAGVVFAGSKDFGYAWTVPYEQVLNFLYKEHADLKVQRISQEMDLFAKDDESKKQREVMQKCANSTDEHVINFCEILQHDMVWRK